MKIRKYISSLTAKEYSADEYCNWGTEKERDGKKDLPKDEYPYHVIIY